ncbi:Type 1 phosphatases regulator [Lachnellula occidentalis]|uniref:Type 1 phosphatases regulator n=1 Tax=Lachnellula occidentalis TaxID=215460 RepID=A0A8H8UJJ5_9HELO|nr:Type 1 phosphatases regulator [Lachnellula occidentalis]
MASNSATGSRPSGSGTTAQTQVQMPASRPTSTSNSTSNPPQIPGTSTTTPVLHLRGATREEEEVSMGARAGRPRIQWAEDVVDNEGLGRKKSKVCCIYHAPKGIDESSDESSSDSSSDSGSDGGDDGGARPSGRGRKEKDCGHEGHGHGKGKGKGRARSPNAYEKVPKVKGKGKD